MKIHCADIVFAKTQDYRLVFNSAHNRQQILEIFSQNCHNVSTGFVLKKNCPNMENELFKMC